MDKTQNISILHWLLPCRFSLIFLGPVLSQMAWGTSILKRARVKPIYRWMIYRCSSLMLSSTRILQGVWKVGCFSQKTDRQIVKIFHDQPRTDLRIWSYEYRWKAHRLTRLTSWTLLTALQTKKHMGILFSSFTKASLIQRHRPPCHKFLIYPSSWCV